MYSWGKLKSVAIDQSNCTKCFAPARWARSKHSKAAARQASRKLRQFLKKEGYKCYQV